MLMLVYIELAPAFISVLLYSVIFMSISCLEVELTYLFTISVIWLGGSPILISMTYSVELLQFYLDLRSRLVADDLYGRCALRGWIVASCRWKIFEHTTLIATTGTHFMNTSGLIHRKRVFFSGKVVGLPTREPRSFIARVYASDPGASLRGSGTDTYVAVDRSSDPVVVVSWLYSCTCATPCEYRGDSVRVNSGSPIFVADLTYSGLNLLFDRPLDAIFLNSNRLRHRRPILANLGDSPASIVVLAHNKLGGCIPPSIGRMADTLNEIVLLDDGLAACVPPEVGLFRRECGG
uniref:Uncharacterized protein n=1 Tax=Ananas comosus var. bracteatus TaxID=296719 RepID=A0A6V7NP06_ANACO|nr:unnamed protein product [Ananas comosus var. bracteatus]